MTICGNLFPYNAYTCPEKRTQAMKKYYYEGPTFKLWRESRGPGSTFTPCRKKDMKQNVSCHALKNVVLYLKISNCHKEGQQLY